MALFQKAQVLGSGCAGGGQTTTFPKMIFLLFHIFWTDASKSGTGRCPLRSQVHPVHSLVVAQKCSRIWLVDARRVFVPSERVCRRRWRIDLEFARRLILHSDRRRQLGCPERGETGMYYPRPPSPPAISKTMRRHKTRRGGPQTQTLSCNASEKMPSTFVRELELANGSYFGWR